MSERALDRVRTPPAARGAPRVNVIAAALAGALYAVVSPLRSVRLTTLDALPPLLMEALLAGLLLPAVLLFVQRLAFSHLVRPLTAASGQEGSRFYRHESWTYAILPAGAAVFAGSYPSMALALALVAATWIVQVVLFISVLEQPERDRLVRSHNYVALLFLVSGFSALIYQVVWQRVLFRSFGINSESVTVIVSVFMFGLGVGALAGGYLQKRYPARLLRLFLVLESGIGLFGLVSLEFIDFASQTPPGGSTTALVLRVYAVLAVPTMLMGATLPVLVAYMQNHLRSLGKTVGLLYAVNTIGSAIAAFATVEVLFVLTGLRGSIVIAALCNFTTALLILDAGRKLGGESATKAPASASPNGRTLSYPVAFMLLMAVGYISLSHEILWFRLLGYMSASRPEVFGLLLAAFLVGIAAGSLRAGTSCDAGRDPGEYLLRSLLSAAVVFYLAIPAVAQATAWAGTPLGLMLAYLAVGVVAYFCGGVLPLLMHMSADGDAAGSGLSVAWLYFANILGATMGPLITGYLLLDLLTLEANIALLAALTLATALALAIALGAIGRDRRPAWRTAGIAAAMALAAWLAHPGLFDGYLEKMQFASTGFQPFLHKLENRSGIITVEGGSDTLYGNGSYDGRFNTDPVNNSNMIDRAYMIAALHRQPRRMLEIGLSTGSWTRVFSRYAPLQEMTVVEINKGYPAVIRNYADIAAVLEDPRIRHVVDDGRRWLRNNPDEKFDLIVMNTTQHWRSNTTNLLSREFLHLCRQHLSPGGVLYYNATESEEVAYTAANVFQHVTKFSSFVAASDAPFDMTLAQKRTNLLRFRGADGLPLFASSEALRTKLDRLAAEPLVDLRDNMARRADLQLITDDNMAVEYKVH